MNNKFAIALAVFSLGFFIKNTQAQVSNLRANDKSGINVFDAPKDRLKAPKYCWWFI
jgi:hypothetical protein